MVNLNRIIFALTGFSFVASSVAQECFDESVYLTTPMKEFIVHDNGTVSHLETGLMWKQCLQGKSGVQCDDGDALLVNWQGAFTELKAVNQQGFAGYSDWRLPNTKELSSIIEFGCHDPALNIKAFPNMESVRVWSSTPVANLFALDSTKDLYSDHRSWFASYDEGEVTFLNHADRTSQQHAVHLVRGAQ